MRRFDHQSGRFLTIDGAQIYVESRGDPNGMPLLLLHGGLGSIEALNGILPYLEGAFHIIGIDSRGQGRSTLGAKALSYAQLQQDVEQIIQQLQLDTVSIIGFSDGGIVGYRLAAQPPVKIERLAAIGAQWELRDDDPVRAVYARITADSWRSKFSDTYEAYQHLNAEADFERLVTSLVQMWLDTSPSGYPGDKVGAISCDLLIARGDDDHLMSREAAFELARRVAGARLLNVPFAGHAAFKEQPEILVRCLNLFLGA